MSKKDKLIQKFKSSPQNFGFHELVTLMGYFGYDLKRGGGSRRKFVAHDRRRRLTLHEPHPNKVLKKYQVHQVREFLEAEGFI